MSQYFFEEIKEKRNQYYVGYEPSYDSGFAFVSLTLIECLPYERIIKYMEYELDYWLKKYRIPVMISAFDDTDSLIYVKDIENSHLFGWFDPTTKSLRTAWEINKVPNFTLEEYGREQWLNHIDIPYKTAEQVKENANKKVKRSVKGVKLLKFFMLMWVCVIPITWIIIQLFSPFWLGVAVTILSLIKALDAGRKVYWKSKKSTKEIKEEEIERKRDHYFYHCELNPEGFYRLRTENFEKESRERNLKEFKNIDY
jgi:hypothetical protein